MTQSQGGPDPVCPPAPRYTKHQELRRDPEMEGLSMSRPQLS